MPLFSVIIPTYNRLPLLEKTLASVAGQTFRDYEIIVVDDGSRDGTLDFLETVAERVKVLTQPNRGPGAARNLGAKHAQGEYLAFLDSDDLWFSWTLETYSEAIKATCPSFIAGKPRCFEAENELESVANEVLKVKQFSDYLASGDEWRWWGVSSFVVRKDAFFEVGGFTEQWVNGEDADLALRFGIAPGFIQIESPFTFGYREHEISAMKNFRRTLAGGWMKVKAEQTHAYPGGRVRAHERWRILTRHLRPITMGCLQNGLWQEAWALYKGTFVWNKALGRFKYLIAFPVVALLAFLRSIIGFGRKGIKVHP